MHSGTSLRSDIVGLSSVPSTSSVRFELGEPGPGPCVGDLIFPQMLFDCVGTGVGR